MILICSNCNELKEYYDINLNKDFHPYNVGNCDVCNENVFEVDELIAPTIIELNKRGWTTKFCCSGHLGEEFLHTYILFEYVPNSAPALFYKDGNSIRVKNPARELSGIEGYDELVMVNRRLYQWALNLPKREEVLKNYGNKRLTFEICEGEWIGKRRG